MSEIALKLIAENKAKHARGEDARVLDLGMCALTKVPKELNDCIWLEELLLGNSWSRTDVDRPTITNIHSRNAGKLNNIETICGIENLKQLKRLCISNSSHPKKLHDLLPIEGLINLQYIDFHFTKVSDLSPLRFLKQLEVVICNSTSVHDFSPLSKLEKLKIIDCSHTNISDLTPLSSLNQLQALIFYDTKVKDLSPISELIQLERLDCSSHLKDLSPISGLIQLKTLRCTSLNLNNLQALKTLKCLETLDLSFSKLFDPFYFFKKFFWKKDAGVLSALKNLKSLKILNIKNTFISDLSALSELTQLKEIHCESTFVHDLSPLSKLDQLEELRLESTRVKNLSPIAGLKKLKRLYFAYTKVDDLSPLSQIEQIQEINCTETRVNDLTPLSNLTNLWKLYCSGTPVKDISPLLPWIKMGGKVHWAMWEAGINVENCPLINPPIEIAKQGNEAIINYFSERNKSQFKNNEIKLILVGNSTTGKTSCSKFLRERTFQFGQSTTHGIHNDRWQPIEHNFRVNIWDFGGQEYYHATHRLFLSRNSVYVLLWDKQTDKEGYCGTPIHFDDNPEPTILHLEHFPQKWWLQNIRHYTHDSKSLVPILLVQNKCARDGIERVPQQFENPPFNLLPEWLDNHIDLEAAADSAHPQHNKWLRQFETFEERLLDKLQSQLAQYEFAVYHREIRDEVRRLASEGVNDLTYPDFEALCRRFDLEAKMDLVQIYLRDITGDILYYPDNKRLKERVFLSPNWVCDSIYQILSRKVQEQEGVFDTEWVQQALKCDEKNALDFVELLREFELVFDDTDESGQPTGQLVAPQYLPDSCTKPDKLEAAKDYANLTYAFTLWFPEFLPKSHVARFVAYWGGNAKQRLFWKNGLLFQTVGCTVLVERIEENKIRVDVQASQPNRLGAIQRIFQSFLNLEDGKAGFVVSLDGQTFVLWQDVLEAIHGQAKQVKTFPYADTIVFTELKPFFIFQQPLMPSPKKVFISYSKSDKAYLEQLKKHLAPLRRQGLLQTWDDLELVAGEPWDAAIHNQLNAADIIILLVSSDFMDTDYVWDIEIKKAIERHERGEATVIPIIIRPSLWQDAPFAYLTAIPEKGKAISTWDNLDEAWAHVGEKIKQAAKQ